MRPFFCHGPSIFHPAGMLHQQEQHVVGVFLKVMPTCDGNRTINGPTVASSSSSSSFSCCRFLCGPTWFSSLPRIDMICKAPLEPRVALRTPPHIQPPAIVVVVVSSAHNHTAVQRSSDTTVHTHYAHTHMLCVASNGSSPPPPPWPTPSVVVVTAAAPSNTNP